MNTELKNNKATLRAFMREHYTDERLAMLLAHAQSGRLAFHSCCCFIGVATADHALNSDHEYGGGSDHYDRAKALPGAVEAEGAFLALRWGYTNTCLRFDESLKNRRLIPMIRAEQRRRERARVVTPELAAVSQ